jgi:hypothetical protein
LLPLTIESGKYLSYLILGAAMTTEAEKNFTPLNKALSQLFRLASESFNIAFDAAESVTDEHFAFAVKDAQTGEKRGEIAFNPYDGDFETTVSGPDQPERTATIHMHLQRPDDANSLPVLTFQETAALITLSLPAFQHILAPK